MARSDIGKEGKQTRFSKTNQPKNRGRKPNILKRYIKLYEVSLEDVKALITNILFVLSQDEVEKLSGADMGIPAGDDIEKRSEVNPDIPIGIAMIASACMGDIKRRKINALDRLLDRVYGKSVQAVDVTGIVSEVPADATERREMIAQLQERMRILDGDQ
jgi:hypothetical protein